MISSTDALRLILERTPVLETERIHFREAAGRVLRRSLVADRALPPFDRVMMDGVALRLRGRTGLPASLVLEGTLHAGQAPVVLRSPNHGWEVMTGAVLPEGCDTVIPLEQYTRSGDRVIFHEDCEAPCGDWVHAQGSDYGRGAVLVPAGRFLGARELAVAASCGRVVVEVSKLPRVAVLSTGDELVAPEVAPSPHQIRHSNLYAVEAMVTGGRRGAIELAHLPDRADAMEAVLAELLERVDALVLSGGVSKGQRDLVPEVLERLGIRPDFHGVRQRPGKPFWFGTSDPGRTVVFGFPGNPLSTLVGARRYLMAALEKMLGVRPASAPTCLPLAEDFEFRPPLTLFLPVEVRPGVEGLAQAWPRPANNSGDYAGVVPTDGFLELPPERECFEAGEVYPFFPWTPPI